MKIPIVCPESHKTYEAFKKAKSIDEAKKSGASLWNLRQAYEKGFLKFVDENVVMEKGGGKGNKEKVGKGEEAVVLRERERERKKELWKEGEGGVGGKSGGKAKEEGGGGGKGKELDCALVSVSNSPVVDVNLSIRKRVKEETPGYVFTKSPMSPRAVQEGIPEQCPLMTILLSHDSSVFYSSSWP